MLTQNLLRLLLLLMLVMLETLSTTSGKYFDVEVQARFEAEVWSVFCCSCLVEVMKLNLGQDSEA